MLKKKVAKSTIVYKGEKANQIIEEANNKEIEENTNSQDEKTNDEVKPEETENENGNEEVKQEVVEVFNEVEKNPVEQVKKDDSEMNIAILGEMMMGGKVTQNLNYIYSTAFKDVYMDINSADFTYTNFSTNITNLDKIENAKSKYLVTKDIVSALRALGVDCVSLASDHIVDFPSDILNNTISILEENEVFEL